MNNYKELVSNSVDARCLKYGIKVKITVYLVLSVSVSLFSIVLLWNYPKEMIETLLFYNSVFLAGYFPMIVLSLIKLKDMIKRSNTYIFSEAVLSEFHTNMRHFYFRITVEDNKGQLIVGNTEGLYTTTSINADFEYWYNRKVLVAYDAELDKMIVLKNK